MCFSFSTQFPDNIGCHVPQGSQLRLSNPWLVLWFPLLLPRCPGADSKHQPIPSHVISFSWLFASEILAELLSLCVKLFLSLNLLEKNLLQTFVHVATPEEHCENAFWLIWPAWGKEGKSLSVQFEFRWSTDIFRVKVNWCYSYST